MCKSHNTRKFAVSISPRNEHVGPDGWLRLRTFPAFPEILISIPIGQSPGGSHPSVLIADVLFWHAGRHVDRTLYAQWINKLFL